MASKKCSKCGEMKVLGDFYIRRRAVGEYQSQCKECSKARAFVWQSCNREIINARRWAKYAADPHQNKRQKTTPEQNVAQWLRITERRESDEEFNCMFKARRRRNQHLSVVALTDSYIKEQLLKNNDLSIGDLPPSLITLKREHLRLQRLIRKQE